MNKREVLDDCLIISDENGAQLLTIKEAFEEGVMNIYLKGNINMSVAHDFEDEMTSVVTVCDRITVDFDGVEVICSAGLKTLLNVQQTLDDRADSVLKLKNLRAPVTATFQEMGFAELFEIEK